MKLQSIIFFLFLTILCICRYKNIANSTTKDLLRAKNFHKKNELKQAQYFYLKNLLNNPNCEYSLVNIAKIGSYLYTQKEYLNHSYEVDPIAVSMWASYKFLSIHPNDTEMKDLLLNNLSLISYENIFFKIPTLLQKLLIYREDFLFLFLFFLSLLFFDIVLKAILSTSLIYQKPIKILAIFLGFLNLFLYTLNLTIQETIFPKKDSTPVFESLSDISISKKVITLPAGIPLSNIKTIGNWKKVSLPSGKIGYIQKKYIISTKDYPPLIGLE